MPNITSPQEKEKLRKRLQKLFQRQEYLAESAAGKSRKMLKMKKNKMIKNKHTNEQQITGQKKQQVLGDKSKTNEVKPTKNLKKQQPVQNKDPTMSADSSKQNGFVKSPQKVKPTKNLKKQQPVQNKDPTMSAESSKQNGFVKSPQKVVAGKKNENLTKSPKYKVNHVKLQISPKTEKDNAKNPSPIKQQTKTKITKINRSQKPNNVNEKSNTKASPSKQQANTKTTKTNSAEITPKIKKDLKKNSQQKEIEKETKINQKDKNLLKQKSQHKLIEKEVGNKEKKNMKQNNELEKKNVKKSLGESKNESQNLHIKENQQQTLKINTNKFPNNNDQTNMNNNQKKRAKKRAATGNTLSLVEDKEETTTTNKKSKLANDSKQTEEKPKKSNKKKDKKFKDNLTNVSASSKFEDEFEDNDEERFDMNGMTGCVMGGEFASDYEEEEDDMEWDYWNQPENSSSESMSEINSEDLTPEEEFNGESQTQLEQYEINESMGSEEEYFDSEDDDDEDDYYDYYSDSGDDEEEEEDYSDFDENDYEEDEDSYNYCMDSEDDYSSNYNNSSYDFHEEDDDNDYELPKHIPEDMIIHKGTAIKHDLKPEHNVAFDSENEEAQIIEIEEQNAVKIINQPKAYEREELFKLKYEGKSLKALTFHRKETTTSTSSDTEDCPKLVPIVDEDGFQLYNPNEETDDEVEEEIEIEEEEYENDSMEEHENDDMDDVSLGSEYTEINSDDADSLLSEDINEKYLNRGHEDSESDYSIDENIWNKKHKVDVIDATGYECERQVHESERKSDYNLNDDIKQIPSLKLYTNVDLKTKSCILSTTIINKKIFNSLEEDNIGKEVYVECNEINKKTEEETEPEPQVTTVEQEIQENIAEQQEELLTETLQQPIKIAKPSGQNLADYKTKFFNALDSNLVVVLLKDPFYIYGTVRLTLLAGNVDIYGHNLKLNTEVEIFSPRGCSQIEIFPSSVTNKNKITKQQLKQNLKSYEQHFALNDLKTINDTYNFETDAIVLLKRNESRKKVVQQFKKFMNENVFPNINNINIDRPLYNSEHLLRCMINTSAHEQKCLRLPQQWEHISITTKSRVMLAGGKSVGKSTLLRYLINRQLPQQVLLIDLDIGQPEVFVPQTVSCTIVKQPLLGPGFMLNLQPEISFAVGHTNIALCAYKYMEAVRALIAHCKAQEAYSNMPWLINTMGYNKGFGLELISVIAQELPLTDLIQLQSSKEINNFDSILHAHILSQVPRIMFPEECGEEETSSCEKPNYRLHVWQSAVQQESRYQKEWEMSAKDLRYAMLLARLSQALQGHAEWLTDIKPLSASLNDLKIVNLLENTVSLSAEELTKSVEGNLVYLCNQNADDKPLKCLGIGVVRAIDYHVQQLYLIPALPFTQLREINCLALGEMPLPTSLFTNQGSRVKNTAPFVYNTVAANASKAIKQMYHRPRKFLTGKHKSLD